MNITLISMPVINWSSFVSNVTASLERSPTRSLDGAGVAPGDFKTYLISLGEFESAKTNPFSFLSSERSLRALRHLHFSFLFSTDEALITFLASINIDILISDDDDHSFVGSGNLEQWREAVLLANAKKLKRGVREALFELQRLLVKIGLGDVLRPFSSE